jgi:predicted transcriptional regulator
MTGPFAGRIGKRERLYRRPNYRIIVRVTTSASAAQASSPKASDARSSAGWTFLTNHAHVLLCIARDQGVRLRDIADHVGITERAAQGIVSDLVEAGYVTRTREGRRNTYEVISDGHFRHPLENEHEIGVLLAALGAVGAGKPAADGRGAKSETA